MKMVTPRMSAGRVLEILRPAIFMENLRGKVYSIIIRCSGEMRVNPRYHIGRVITYKIALYDDLPLMHS